MRAPAQGLGLESIQALEWVLAPVQELVPVLVLGPGQVLALACLLLPLLSR